MCFVEVEGVDNCGDHDASPHMSHQTVIMFDPCHIKPS
jgi:hypothetical protein